MNTLLRHVISIGLAVVLTAGMLSAQPHPSGRWDGAILVMGQELGIRVYFGASGDSLTGKIDIPMQGAFGLALTNMHCVPPSIGFDLPAGPGLATFRGNVSADSMSGRFEQSGIAGTFSLRPVRTDSASAKGAGTSLPYKSREVTFTDDTVRLAGTLTIPNGEGPFPGLVMITGSGPQNRDEELFGFKPFGIIADHLTRKGIAVLRFDDRGIGMSAGRFAEATTSDFSRDAEAGLDFLRQQAGIRKDAVGLLGHSEGGLAAAMAAARRKDVSFVIFMAAPAIPGDSLIDFQLSTMARRSGASTEEVDHLLAVQHRVYKAVRERKGFEEVQSLLMDEGKRSLEKLPEASRKKMASPDSLIRSRVAIQMTSIKSPWFREFTTFDPTTALEKVTCPVLAFFGEVDQQVPPSLNRRPMEQALARAGNRNVVVHTLPKANHLFISSETGDPAEYPTLQKEFVGGLLDEMSSWLRRRDGR